jgi:DNA-binding GntR family transcriptional regulator
MARTRQGRTLVEDAYNALRAKILHGELAPGARLHLQGLAREFDVSLSVVREAATRVAAEELVVAMPQQGFRVRPVSVPDLLDLTWMRVELESLALQRSVENGDVAWEASLVAAHHTMMATPVHRADDTLSPAWMTAHSAFHAALAAACGSPLLIRIRQQLFDAAEVYRYWSDRVRKAVKDEGPREHTLLLKAALAHDPVQTVNIATQHLQRTTDYLVESIEGRSDVGSAARRPRRPRTRAAAKAS